MARVGGEVGGEVAAGGHGVTPKAAAMRLRVWQGRTSKQSAQVLLRSTEVMSSPPFQTRYSWCSASTARIAATVSASEARGSPQVQDIGRPASQEPQTVRSRASISASRSSTALTGSPPGSAPCTGPLLLGYRA